MNRWKLPEALILAYLVADAVAYRHLVRADPSHALETGTMLKNLAVSFVWPLYWAMRYFS